MTLVGFLAILCQSLALDLGSIYMGPDPFGTDTKLVRISLVFTQDPVDPVWIRSAFWNQMHPLMKVILFGTIPLA